MFYNKISITAWSACNCNCVVVLIFHKNDLFEVSDGENSENEENSSSKRPDNIELDDGVPEAIQKHLSPEDLFKDIQEVKDKLKEVRELLDPGQGQSQGHTRVKSSSSEGFLKRHCANLTDDYNNDHTDKAEEIFNTIAGVGNASNSSSSDALIKQLKELREELKSSSSSDRRTPEGIEDQPKDVYEVNLSNLAGFLKSKIEEEKIIKNKKEEEEMIEKAANEIFNETFENILNSGNDSSGMTHRRSRQSIKNRIASIETGDWRFSSDEEMDYPEDTTPAYGNSYLRNKALSKKGPESPGGIVEENFSVKDLKSAWENNIEHQRSDNPAACLTSMITRTENAFNEVEATFQVAENKMDLALLHTEKVIDQSRQIISSDSNTEEANDVSIDDEASVLTDASKTDSVHTPTDKEPEVEPEVPEGGEELIPSRNVIIID